MRPAAFNRGAMRNATSVALSLLALSDATSSSAFSPAFTGWRRPSSPSLAKTRFSPTSGTASAMVAMATILRNDGSRRARPFSSSKSCASLKATPAPHSALHGYAQPAWFGIQHRQRGRYAVVFGQVMVGDDQVHTETLRGFGGGEGANAGVHADDERHSGGGGALDHVVLHAVAFADAVRHVEVGAAAAQLDRGFQNDDGGGAVHVVVAVDEDLLAVGDGAAQALGGLVHAEHQVRRVQVIEFRIQELVRVFGGRMPRATSRRAIAGGSLASAASRVTCSSSADRSCQRMQERYHGVAVG